MTKILLIGPEPDKMPRLKLTYKCLKSLGHDVEVFNAAKRGRSTIIRYIVNMFRLLFKRAEVYHFFNVPDVIGLPLLFKRGRVVYDVRSPWKEVMLDTTGNKYLAKFAGIVEKMLYRKADDVIVANPLLGERALDYGAKDFVVVPNYIYEELSIDGWEDIKNMYVKDEEKEEALVLFFGKISKVEGSEVLGDIIIETLNIDYDLFNIRFLILGDGPELQSLIDRITEAGLLDRTHFLGWIPHKLIGGWIQAADLCIMPREEFGTTEWIHPDAVWKVNESLSIGTPVVATECVGFQWDKELPTLIITKNKDFSTVIMGIAEVALRWGEDSKKPIKRDWEISRDRLAEVYGYGDVENV